jgi:diguanylate cyclase (GGDEF)-like protein
MKPPAEARNRKMASPLRILHVEDNALDAELLYENLKKSGLVFEVQRVASHTDFLSALTKHEFDLILCDYSLPSFSGRDALALAQEECPDVPFIFASGTIGEERAVEVLKSGATDYVLKDRMARLGPAIQRAMQEAKEYRKRKQMEEEIRRLAYSDPVTGLPNRASLNERLEQFLRADRENQGPVGLLLMNLSHFADINNTLGHKNGDLLLQKIGQRLKRAMPDPALVAAPGGDRFAVLLQGDIAQAAFAAELMLGTLREPVVIEGLRLDMEAIVGIALYPAHGHDPGTLFRRADIALSLAKNSQHHFAFYDPAHDYYSQDRLALIGELRNAIKENQLVLHYQPKTDLKTGQVTSAEALMRWQHPKRGMLPPMQFISLAEHTGLIKQLTEWAIHTALRQIQDWQKEGLDLAVAVNLSARNLLDPGLPHQIGRFLKRFGVAPERLELEITESVIMADPVRALDCLTQLNQMGLRLSVDDFGTGYSSLAYLKRLPVHELKIDQAFVQGLMKDRNDAAIVRAAIDLGRGMGLTQVAEGVENQQTWHGLMALGCDMLQGNFLSKPLPATDFVCWLRWLREALPGSAPKGTEGR